MQGRIGDDAALLIDEASVAVSDAIGPCEGVSNDFYRSTIITSNISLLSTNSSNNPSQFHCRIAGDCRKAQASEPYKYLVDN
jgi:hypothetical protein